METIDDDIAARASEFIEKQHKAGKPIFVWVNFTHMHFRTHPKPESIGQAGRWLGPYADVMIDHDKNVGTVLKKPEALKELDNTNKLQREIWDLSVKSSKPTNDRSARMLLLPALNQMIDITTTRKNSILTHSPLVILFALMSLAYVCAFLGGIAMSKSTALKWIHAILYSAITSLFIYLVLDIEYPRYGFVNLEKASSLLVEIRDGMQQKTP
jgi:hypothetical protein